MDQVIIIVECFINNTFSHFAMIATRKSRFFSNLHIYQQITTILSLAEYLYPSCIHEEGLAYYTRQPAQSAPSRAFPVN